MSGEEEEGRGEEENGGGQGVKIEKKHAVGVVSEECGVLCCRHAEGGCPAATCGACL